MRTFLEGCFITFCAIVVICLVIVGFLGSVAFIFWSFDKNPGYTLLGLTGACVIWGGIDKWWEERQQHKRWYGENK